RGDRLGAAGRNRARAPAGAGAAERHRRALGIRLPPFPSEGAAMVRAIVLYEGEVDPARYERHVEEFVRPIPATFRHGKVFGAAVGEPKFAYYAEFEFPDMESFR